MRNSVHRIDAQSRIVANVVYEFIVTKQDVLVSMFVRI
jgi:hypothetical protein